MASSDRKVFFILQIQGRDRKKIVLVEPSKLTVKDVTCAVEAKAGPVTDLKISVRKQWVDLDEDSVTTVKKKDINYLMAR